MELKYGYVRAVALPFEEALIQMEAALKAEDFGVLCQIDLQAKLAEKLGVEFPRYRILGACNPPLAHEALKQEINLGLLLPCNVIVYEKDHQTWVGTVDAAKMLEVVGNPEMNPMAEEVNRKLRRAVDAIGSSESREKVARRASGGVQRLRNGSA
jgi:uncharacterized protein (DUF302 family)